MIEATELAARLETVEQKVAQLTQAVADARREDPADGADRLAGQGPAAKRTAPEAGTPRATLDEEFWALSELQRRSGGSVLYVGDVPLPKGGSVAWQYGRDSEAILADDWARVAPVLAALGHRVRLAILRHVLAGSTTVSALVEELGDGTSGQVYHHLRELTATGWLTSKGRGSYGIPAARIVPLLAILLAAGCDGSR